MLGSSEPTRRKPYTVASLADHWSVSQNTVYAMIRSGRLKAFQFGGKLYRIRPEEVERFETAEAVPPTGAAPPPAEGWEEREKAFRRAERTEARLERLAARLPA